VSRGLGTYAQWDERLDACLPRRMSLQAVKAVEIVPDCRSRRSRISVHDEIGYGKPEKFTGFTRTGNNAGGIEAVFPMEKRYAYAAT